MALRLGFIVESLAPHFDAQFLGDPEVLIERLTPIDLATSSDLSFLGHPKYKSRLASSKAACVIVTPDVQADAVKRGPCIVVANPYHYFALVSQLWKRQHRAGVVPSIHPTALIDASAKLGSGVSVGAYACINAGVILGDGVRVGAHSVIEQGAVIGADSEIANRVTVGHNCRIGERCVLHSGAVIGADGFGFAAHEGHWIKVEQLGNVHIGNDVEIGANTCIDRGALQDTVLEDGVKLDNLIQIGHNVHVGAHTAMAGCVGVAGSAYIGAHCTVGGGAVVLGHLRLADHVHISAASTVTRSILKPGHYSGMFPIADNAAWEKNAASLKQLYSLRERIKALEKQLNAN